MAAYATQLLIGSVDVPIWAMKDSRVWIVIDDLFS